MADEDALFAEFMGEIKSTVLATDAAGDDADGAASDTASVGDVNADNDINNGSSERAGEEGAETNKRRGEASANHCSETGCLHRAEP